MSLDALASEGIVPLYDREWDRTRLGDRLHAANVLEDKCMGSLLGLALADALGAGCEFLGAVEIREKYGLVHSFIDAERRPAGRYTDDTEMALALAQSLLHTRSACAEHCAVRYAELFVQAPRRGYGPGAARQLGALADGTTDFRHSGTVSFADGSYGNGGAMRIAPVALAFRAATANVLLEAVRAATMCTHVHPEGVDGAYVQAIGVQYALSRTADAFVPDAFLAHAIAHCTSDVVRDKLVAVREYVRGGGGGTWDADWAFAQRVCAANQYGRVFSVRASEAVALVFYAVARYYADPVECLVRLIGLGGDTDTTAAMAGAILGALHGTAWIPARWFDALENDEGTGRDELVRVARALVLLDLCESSDVRDEWAAFHVDDDGAPLQKTPVLFAKTPLRHESAVQSMWCSADGRTLVAGGSDATRVWDLASATCTAVLKFHRGPVPALWVSPDLRTIVSGGKDGMVVVWHKRVSDGDAAAEPSQEYDVHASLQAVPSRSAVVDLVAGVDADGTAYLVAVLSAAQMAVFELRTATGELEPRGLLRGHTRPITGACALDGGEQLVSVGTDGTMRLWAMRVAETAAVESRVLHSAPKALASLATNDDDVVCAGGRHGAVLVRVSSGETVAELTEHGAVSCVAAVSDDGSFVIGTFNHAALSVSASGEILREIPDAHSTSLSAVLGTSRVLFTAANAGEMRMWSRESGVCLAELRGHKRGVGKLLLHEAAPSASASTQLQLMSACTDRFARVWEVCEAGVVSNTSVPTWGVAPDELTAVMPPELAWLLTFVDFEAPRDVIERQVCVHVGDEEGGEAVAALVDGGWEDLLPLLLHHGVLTRWRAFVAWLREHGVPASDDPRDVFARFAQHLGRVVSHRALALDEEAYHRIVHENTILPSGRLRTSHEALMRMVHMRGFAFIAVARLYIGLGLLRPGDPSLSLHDDGETAVCIADGYLNRTRAVYLFRVSVPVIETMGWSVFEVQQRAPRILGDERQVGSADTRWFSHRGVWFDAHEQRTERYTLHEVPFLRQRLLSTRAFRTPEETAEFIAPFAAAQQEKKDASDQSDEL